MTFQFNSLIDFLNMAGHGPYVWASYAITTIALVTLVVYPLMQKKQIIAQIRRQQRISNPPE